jgi:hypothetical protein
MINKLTLNKKSYINMRPIPKCYRVTGVRSSRGGDVLFHSCHKCLTIC